jgi:hypothetical protein
MLPSAPSPLLRAALSDGVMSVGALPLLEAQLRALCRAPREEQADAALELLAALPPPPLDGSAVLLALAAHSRSRHVSALVATLRKALAMMKDLSPPVARLVLGLAGGLAGAPWQMRVWAASPASAQLQCAVDLAAAELLPHLRHDLALLARWVALLAPRAYGPVAGGTGPQRAARAALAGLAPLAAVKERLKALHTSRPEGGRHRELCEPLVRAALVRAPALRSLEVALVLLPAVPERRA